MIQNFYNIKVQTIGQNLYEFTSDIIKWIEINKFRNGIINISIQHTSASLIIQENADPDVQKDLLNFFNKLVPMDNSFTLTQQKAKMICQHILNLQLLTIKYQLVLKMDNCY